MAKVDIAVPCYNYGRFLRDCVESILSQGIADLRVRIIDNASTDNSVEVAQALAAADSRVSVAVHEKNLGPHASFNEGIDWASAEYFMILCSDDLLVPGALASMVEAMDRDPATSFAYGYDVEWHYCDDPEAPTFPAPAPQHWRLRDGMEFIYERCAYPDRHVSYGMILTRTSAQKAAGHYRPELPHADDFEMLLRLACYGRVADTRDIVGIRRMHQTNRSQDYIGKRTGYIVERLDAFESFFANKGRTLPEAEKLHAIARSSLSGQAYWRGVKDLVRGQRSAFDLLGLSIRLQPMSAVVPPFGYLSRMRRPLYKRIMGLP